MNSDAPFVLVLFEHIFYAIGAVDGTIAIARHSENKEKEKRGMMMVRMKVWVFSLMSK